MTVVPVGPARGVPRANYFTSVTIVFASATALTPRRA
jgi:hypothetical protein